ncbi:hypothetical protein D3C86_1786640 [compost metagenome]
MGIRCISDCVGDQVDDHLFNPLFISKDIQRVYIAIQADLMGRMILLHDLNHIFQNTGKIETSKTIGQFSGLYFRYIQ